MSTEAAQRVCRFSSPDSDTFIDVTIVGDDFVIAASPNMVASGRARYFDLAIKKKSDTDDEYFGCLFADQGVRVHLSLTLEQVTEIHAVIPEIAFTDERVEVQP